MSSIIRGIAELLSASYLDTEPAADVRAIWREMAVEARKEYDKMRAELRAEVERRRVSETKNAVEEWLRDQAHACETYAAALSVRKERDELREHISAAANAVSGDDRSAPGLFTADGKVYYSYESHVESMQRWTVLLAKEKLRADEVEHECDELRAVIARVREALAALGRLSRLYEDVGKYEAAVAVDTAIAAIRVALPKEGE